jgi:phosphoglycolate phosphatase-like HAD superfamily hydrolase
MPQPQPLPGAVELLRFPRQKRVRHGVATSNRHPRINAPLKAHADECCE